jgi:predicted DNA-binding WGR domain protein
MRRFELVEGASGKFWEITIEGSSFTVHFGRIGTKGQSQTKSFASPDGAKAAAEKLIEEKVGKGYLGKRGEAGEPRLLERQRVRRLR